MKTKKAIPRHRKQSKASADRQERAIEKRERQKAQKAAQEGELCSRYLGVLGILARCSSEVSEENREMIEAALEDAESVVPIKWNRVNDSIDVRMADAN